jgi:hypothetical protein
MLLLLRRMMMTRLRSQILVLELDELGVGYDDAQPCRMCCKAVVSSGIRNVLNTTQHGIAFTAFGYNPEMECESLNNLRGGEY